MEVVGGSDGRVSGRAKPGRHFELETFNFPVTRTLVIL